jgi:hypothetical protein
MILTGVAECFRRHFWPFDFCNDLNTKHLYGNFEWKCGWFYATSCPNPGIFAHDTLTHRACSIAVDLLATCYSHGYELCFLAFEVAAWALRIPIRCCWLGNAALLNKKNTWTYYLLLSHEMLPYHNIHEMNELWPLISFSIIYRSDRKYWPCTLIWPTKVARDFLLPYGISE